MLNELLTVGELAELLKVKKAWVYSQTRQSGADAIPRLYIGKYIRFRPKEVERWLLAQRGDAVDFRART